MWCYNTWIIFFLTKFRFVKYTENRSDRVVFFISCMLMGYMHMFISWCQWHVYMMTSLNGNIFRVTGLLCGEFTGHGEFPSQRPATRSFGIFFELRPNERLSKPSRRWFEAPSCSLWRHCNVKLCCCSRHGMLFLHDLWLWPFKNISDSHNFGHSCGDSPITFNHDCVTGENRWRITPDHPTREHISLLTA